MNYYYLNNEISNSYNDNIDRFNEGIFETYSNHIFSSDEFSGLKKEKEKEEEGSKIESVKGFFYNTEPKINSKNNNIIPTNFTSKKIPNIFDLENKNVLTPPLELNLIFKNENENQKIIEKDKDKKFYEDFINKKRKLYMDNYDKSKENQKIGRKAKISRKTGLHNKFSDDNIKKKIILIILKIMLEFCNNKIRNIYGNIIGFGKYKKQLLKIDIKKKNQQKLKFNKNFINKTLKDIFSENISNKYLNYDKNHNTNLIKDLLNEKDEMKRIQFENLFNFTFLDCLKHFRGIETYPEFIGMTLFEEECKSFENEEDYEDYKIFLEYYTKNFEDIINVKKNRNRKPKNS